jgi:hypothetical protein
MNIIFSGKGGRNASWYFALAYWNTNTNNHSALVVFLLTRTKRHGKPVAFVVS